MAKEWKVISTTEHARETREAFIDRLNREAGMVADCPSCRIANNNDVSNDNSEKPKESKE